MARKSKDQKDRTSLVISLVLHAILILGVGIWAWKSGQAEKILRKILQVVKTEKETKKEEPQQTKTQPPPQLPPINQGLPPPTGSGTRRAVAADAPEAAGDTFLYDTRKQVQGPSTAGAAKAAAPPPQIRVIRPPPPPKPSFGAAPKSTIKQLYAERAKEAAATEAFGAEQISKTGVSDAGDIINKVAGASVVEGKFAVIRGLSDRYVSTTLNGAEVPSPDPYRRSASLDMFPAQVIDKVVISKTFTPDQPGTATGGGINIVTKAFPDRPFASLTLGASYNTQATGNEDFLTYKGGDTDWFGMDDGTRALPPELSGPSVVIPNAPINSGRPNSANYARNVRNADQLNAMTRALGATQFAPDTEAPPWNHGFAVAAGDTQRLFGKPFGLFTGMSYRREFSFYEDGISRRYGAGNEIRRDKSDTRGVEEVNWAGMVNLAYQIAENHQLGFNFLYNQNSDDQARVLEGTTIEDPGVVYHENRLHWTERNLTTYQLTGSHVIAPEWAGVKVDWMGALSQTTQEEPDTRFFNFANRFGTPELGLPPTPEPRYPTRYFRELDEDNENLKADVTLPFRQWTWDQGQLKQGLYYSQSERTFLDREIYYQDGTRAPPFNGDPNDYLQPDLLGYNPSTNQTTGVIAYNWERFIQGRESAYDASQTIPAAYVMLDLPVVSRVRLIGGARIETTDMEVNSRSYQAHPLTGMTTNSSAIKQADVLPSVGLVFTVVSNMNLRLNYSETVARPSFRELAAYRSYDPTLDELLVGNPELGMSAIKNYDVRWEWFPRPGELYSVSLYYKELIDAIERRYITVDGDIITFINRPDATVYGLELEARKNLDFIDPNLSYFSIGGNLSLIKSEVDLTDDEFTVKQNYVPDVDRSRPLYDQSPYILNVDFSYDNPETGTSATVVYNLYGPRVTIASLNTEDVYEQPAPILDFIFSQKITRHLSLKVTLKNLLDPEIERTYGEDSNLLYSSYRRGRTFGISMSYDF